MKYDVVELFPTAVYVGNMDNHLIHKKVFLENFEKYDFFPTPDLTVVSEANGNPLLHLDDKFENIFLDISTHLKTYVRDVLLVKDVFDIFITKSWISKATKAENDIRWHIHSPSHISFIYYLEYPDNSQVLKFLNKNRPNELFDGLTTPNDIPERMFIKDYNQYNCRTADFKMSEGSLVIFPSNLSHSISDAQSNFKGMRLAIVGDAILILKDNQLENFCSFIHQKYWKQY